MTAAFEHLAAPVRENLINQPIRPKKELRSIRCNARLRTVGSFPGPGSHRIVSLALHECYVEGGLSWGSNGRTCQYCDYGEWKRNAHEEGHSTVVN